MHFLLYSFKNLLLFLIPAVLAFHFWDWSVAVLVYVTLVLIWFGGHLFQLSYFVRYLYKPDLSSLPTGYGIWQTLFSMIRRREKRYKNRKKKINKILQRFYRTNDLMPDGAVLLNQKGRIEWMNRPAQKHLNLSQYLDLNGKFTRLFNNQKLTDFLSNPQNAGVNFYLDIVNTENPSLSVKIILKFACFDKEHIIVFTQDVTQLTKLDTMRRDFVANVSHELRMPLTVINGFIETMKETPSMSEEDRSKFFDLMKVEGERMQNLLSDLLTLSKIEMEDRESQKEAVNLSIIVNKIYLTAQTLSDKKHYIKLDCDSDLWVLGIEGDLYVGLSNIVFNAIRYTPEGGTIRVSLKKVDFNPREYHIYLENFDKYKKTSAESDANSLDSDNSEHHELDDIESDPYLLQEKLKQMLPESLAHKKISSKDQAYQGGVVKMLSTPSEGFYGDIDIKKYTPTLRYQEESDLDEELNSKPLSKDNSLDQNFLVHANQKSSYFGKESSEKLTEEDSAHDVEDNLVHEYCSLGDENFSESNCKNDRSIKDIQTEIDEDGILNTDDLTELSEKNTDKNSENKEEFDIDELDKDELEKDESEECEESEKTWFALFAVEDTGLGIAKEHIPRLTERFYRVDSGRSRKMGGTGLGLAITKHVLNEHHSELKIQSQLGQGSTFSCLLELYDKPVSLSD